MHRVLIIDDNQAIHDDFRKILEPRQDVNGLASTKAAIFGPAPARVSPKPARFEMQSALQGEVGMQMVKQAVEEGRPYSLAFVDMRMPPGWDGLQTIEKLWGVDPHLQVVICSAYSDHSWEEITQRLGLTDRLLILKKPFDPAEVSQIASALSEKWSLKQQASLKMDQLERLVAQRTQDLSRAALHDKLTGLPNRAMLRDTLTRMLQETRSNGHDLCVLFLDFDRFKVVNDSLGHDTGDLLLIEIANRLQSTLKSLAYPDFIAARLGGDEFVVAVRGPAIAASILELGEQLLAKLAEPYVTGEYNLTTTASIGITTTARGYTSADEMLRDADISMYQAKAAGKARCVLFDQCMHQRIKERLALESDLKGVTERGELVLHFQPVIELESGDLHGFEALVRWNHPVRGMISPAEFVPVAEETGEIHRIGLWVLNNACRQLAMWRARFPERAHLSMSVNVSAKQLGSRTVVSDIAQALSTAQLPAQSLAVEITESAVIEDPEFATSVLKSIASLGVGIHMDDFGTGYTSFSYLHRLPLNTLKLDRMFMKSVTERRDYAAIVHAVVTLAHNLKIRVVAEGVETPEQVATLLAVECNYAQGFLFGRPMEAQAAGEFLARGAFAREQVLQAVRMCSGDRSNVKEA